jgi:tetratricopeptide (TPR) repeat protein
MAAKNIKIFIASAGEVKAEREKAILLLNHLRKSHRHLDLEPIEWEYDIVPGSQPGYDSVQSAIDPKLLASDVIVFIFHSRIGQYTRHEFEVATQANKKIFAYFKEGFSPSNKAEHAQFGDLIDFRDNLNATILRVAYKDADAFGGVLYQGLSQYLSEAYPSEEAYQQLSIQYSSLIQSLEQERQKVEELKTQLPTPAINEQIARLNEQIAHIEAQLAQSEALRQQQTADKAALEQQLATQKESDQLKARALEAVEQKDYTRAEELLQASAADSITATANTFYELAKIKKLQFQYRAAFDYYELAAKIAPDNCLYLHDAGQAAGQLGYVDKELTYFEQSLPLAIAEYGERHPEIGIRYNNLGATYYNKGEYNQAIKYFEKSLEIGKEFYGERHPEIGTRYNNLGEAYRQKGEYNRAIGYYEQALSIDEEFYGKRHTDVAIDYNNLGETYRQKGEYDLAIEYYELASSISKEFYGERHPQIALNYNNLGSVYYSKGEYDLAIEYYELASSISKEFYGERHPQIALNYNNLGAAYRQKGKYDLAIEYYKQALSIGKEFYGERHPQIAIRYNNLGSVYYSKGEYDQAIVYYEESLAVKMIFFEIEHPSVQTTIENLQAAKDAQAKGGKDE